MKSNIDNIFLEMTDRLAFLSVDQAALSGFGKMPKDFVIPVFVEDIKKMGQGADGFTTREIASAILYLLGIDSQFKYHEAYEAFLKKAIDRPEALAMELGMEKYDKKSYKDALIYLRSAMELGKEEVYPLFNYGQIALEFARATKNPALANDLMIEGQRAFERVLRLNHKECLANFQLGLIYMEQEKTTDAQKCLQIAFEEGDAEIKEKARILLGDILGSEILRKAEEAIDTQYFEKAIQLIEEVNLKEIALELRYHLLFAKGFAYKALGKLDEAITSYEEALTIQTRDALLLAELGICYAYAREFEQSLEFYMGALDIQRDSVELLNNIAIVYLNMGNVEKAKEFIGYAHELSDNDEIVEATILEIRKYEEQHQ